MTTQTPNTTSTPQPNTPPLLDATDATAAPALEPFTTTALPKVPSRIDPKVRTVITILLAVFISLGIVALTIYFQKQLRELGNAGLIGLFVISNATVIVPAPVSIAFSCAVAPIYGPLAVGIASGLGSALGEITGYWVGRSGNSIIPKGDLYRRLRIFMRRRGLLTIFLLSAVPNPFFDVGGMIAGALKMPLWRFLAACAVGKVLRFIITASICLGGLPWLQHLFLR